MIPETIYLQWYTEGEVTWCTDRIHDTDIEYQRAAPPKCSRCGTTENVTFGPDPYDSDVYNDDTPAWLCEACCHESADDI